MTATDDNHIPMGGASLLVRAARARRRYYDERMPILGTLAKRTLRLGFATAALAVAPVQVLAQAPNISSPGVTRLQPKSYLYRPKGIASPAPLIVLLHGAGGDAKDFLDRFKEEAVKRGVVLLSLQSADRTWQLKAPADSDADVSNLHQSLRALLTDPLIDPRRIVVMGFSDGASFALSLGMAEPDLFRTIVALSPGYAFAPNRIDPGQRIIIVHGRRDGVLPAANARVIVRSLKRAGYSPEVRWFNGGHQIDPDLTRAALDDALRP
jgi:phospholipase/carboxylesterase